MLSLIALGILTMGALPAAAQTRDYREPVAVARGLVTLNEARAIVYRQGIVMIEDIDFDRGDGLWEIEGRDRWGRDAEIDIDAGNGDIMRLERD
jgi:uncharacterized membrane protein YkoI